MFQKLLSLLLLVGATLLLAGCTSDKDTLQELGLADLSGKEILEGLADGSIEALDYSVSVYDYELLVITENKTIAVPMPEDEFYLSVAPYVNVTHECQFHSATGCRGELKNVSFHVTFITSDGTVVYDEDMSTMSNGFIDLWLPRDVEGTLTITDGNLTTSKTISTASGEHTCETEMQLA